MDFMTSSTIQAADNEWYRLNYQKGVAIINAKVRWVLYTTLCVGVVVQSKNKNYYVHSFIVQQSWVSCETIENFQANIKLHLHSELGVLLGKLSITNSLQCKLRFFDEV